MRNRRLEPRAANRVPRARKRFGQHFLEAAWVEKLLRAIAPSSEDLFVEIGPGRGAITAALAARSRRVVAFEIDRDLAAALKRSAPPNLTIVEGDFLEVGPSAFASLLSPAELRVPIRIAGNLPYNVGSPILFKLLELAAAGLPFSDAHLMLQREVADRLVAAPGTGAYGLLTVLVGHRAAVDRVLALPPGAFRPAPKVHSAVVRLRFHAPEPPVVDAAGFSRLVRAAFAKRRKTLVNALGPDLRPALPAAGIEGGRRAETLTIEEFARLADAAARLGLPAAARAVL